MPSGRPRTPSRGRPTTRGGRSQSASRKAKSPPKKAAKSHAKKKSKSPTKTTPKPRSSSRSRKVATAPAAVSAKQREPSRGRPASPRSHMATRKTTTTAISRATPRPTSSISVSTSQQGPRGSASPPMLRSRALGAALAQQIAPTKKGWGQMLKDNIASRQISKFARTIKRGPKPWLKTTTKHLKTNWKYWLLAFAILLLAGLIYKFQRELLVNVQQINKQVMEFVQQQYEQQRRIFGEYWLMTQKAVEQARKKYLNSQSSPPQSAMENQQSSTPSPSSSIPPPKPTRLPHLTDTV